MEPRTIPYLTSSTKHLHRLPRLIQVTTRNVKLESFFKVPYCTKYSFSLSFNGKPKLLSYYTILHAMGYLPTKIFSYTLPIQFYINKIFMAYGKEGISIKKFFKKGHWKYQYLTQLEKESVEGDVSHKLAQPSLSYLGTIQDLQSRQYMKVQTYAS